MAAQRLKRWNPRRAPLKLTKLALLLATLLLVACSQASSSNPHQPQGASVDVQIQAPSGLDAAPFDQPRQLKVPPGFAISVYARVAGARFLAVTPDDKLLVSQPLKNKISLLRPGSDGAQVSDFLTDLDGPHDMVFDTIAGATYLYIGERNAISRYIYHASNDTATDRQVVVKDLPGNGYHPLKSIAIDAKGYLYVMVGSRCNVPHNPADCGSEENPEGMTRGSIYRYRANQLGALGKDGQLYAQGLRNAEGLAFVPGTDELWITINGRDSIPYPFKGGKFPFGKVVPEYVYNHPPDGFTHVMAGANFGWPYCNADPDTKNGLVNMPFDIDAEINPDGAFDCSKATRIDQGIPAHSAPLGLLFLQDTNFPAPYRNGALIAFHAWNAPDKSGYKIAYYPWENGRPGEEMDLVSGWGPPKAWGKPVDMAVDQQGNLFISDDESGAVYQLSYQGP